ncbi:MAG TPA: desulfoferrodoxin [Ruminococcus sp.]|nr:desulfoferrodoxin [Ruminococcus sp.]
MKFYLCKECGKVFAVQDGEDFDPEGKEELIANTVDAAKEKHVPVISREGQTVTVSVGSAAHPMLENHFIQWILLETKNGIERKDLQPGEEPVAQFYVAEDDTIIAAYEYCNLHGVWKAEA